MQQCLKHKARRSLVAAFILSTLALPFNDTSKAVIGLPTAFKEHVHLFKDLDSSGDMCNYRKECLLISEAVVYESRGEPEEGQKMVIDVILNRLEDRRYPDTVEGVLYQPYQFSYTMDKDRQTPPKKEVVDKIKRMTYNYLKSGERRKELLRYHSNKVIPTWSNRLVKVAEVGNHIFYKEK
mgnify:FL=1